jgi:hypothetical protein
MPGLLLLLAFQAAVDSIVVSGVIAGVVTDMGRRPIQRAVVEVTPGNREVKTDRDGRFEFKELSPQQYSLAVRALGYLRQTVSVVLDSTRGSWIRVPLGMVAQPLPEVEVKVSELKPAEYAPTTKYDGFFERRRKGTGTFIDRDEIDRVAPHHITQLFQLASGFHVRLQPPGTPGSTTPTTVRISRCPGNPPPMAIYVDGQRLYWGPQKSVAMVDPNSKPPWVKDEPEDFASEKFAELLDDINPRNIEMIEVYRGVSQIPSEFARDVCAVVAIWTRWNQ